MNLKELTIEGYKSIGKISISNPNPFTVFVGPNASGKSNIFEAIEFFSLCHIMKPDEASKLYGSPNEILNQQRIIEGVIDVEVNIGGKANPQVRIGFEEVDGILYQTLSLLGNIGKYDKDL